MLLRLRSGPRRWVHIKKNAPIRGGDCILLHPLIATARESIVGDDKSKRWLLKNKKNPQGTASVNCVGCTGFWVPGSRVGQRLLRGGAMQFTGNGFVVHWGFGLGKIR